jgi:uncharacterized protein YpmS
MQAGADLKIHKKTRFKKKLYFILIVSAFVSAVVIIVFALLFHRPAYYQPLDLTGSKEESVYLTHELGPELYNGAQMQEPFDLVITQEGINDVIARRKWPQVFGSIRFSAPMVFFVPDSIVLMGIVSLNGAEFVVTIIAEPNIDSEGLLNLQVVRVKIGAVDITPLAGVLARRICQQRFANKGFDTKDLWNKMIVSAVNGQPFEPVFKVEDKKVRMEKIKIEQKKLTIWLVPVFD